MALALLGERAGADGITVHLREDRRHIQERDVWRLRESIATRLNLEMACTPAMTEFALKLKPESVCLVPENRAGNHHRGRPGRRWQPRRGPRLHRRDERRRHQDQPLHRSRRRADRARRRSWARRWSSCTPAPMPTPISARIARRNSSACAAARRPTNSASSVNAGHGINYVNIAEVRTLPHLHELNIGHSIISRALFTGIEEAVREMKERMNP